MSAVEEGKPGVTRLSESLHDRDEEQCKRLAISPIGHIREEEIVALQSMSRLSYFTNGRNHA